MGRISTSALLSPDAVGQPGSLAAQALFGLHKTLTWPACQVSCDAWVMTQMQEPCWMQRMTGVREVGR